MAWVRTLEVAGERVSIREAVPGDVELIFPTWVAQAFNLRNVRRGVFDSFYPKVVAGLLETESAVVLTREGQDKIHAWACGRAPNLLHFAYVPFPIRKHGFGRAVIESVLEGYPDTIYVTSSPLSDRQHRRFVYNPFLLRQ